MPPANLSSLTRTCKSSRCSPCRYGIRIAYEALSWGRHVNEYPQAWQIVAEADRANLGLALDSFHMLATGTSREALEEIDPAKIFLVQLADFMWREIRSREERIDTARHMRVFPGEGVHSAEVAELVRTLDRLGYRGDYSFEVFNDDYTQLAGGAGHRARPALGKMADRPGVAAQPAAARGRSLNASASSLRRAHRRAHALPARRRALPPRSRRGHLPSGSRARAEARLPLKEKKGLEREQGRFLAEILATRSRARTCATRCSCRVRIRAQD